MNLKRRGRRRGIAGVLGAVILFAMVFTAGLSLVLYTISQDNNLNVAQATSEQSAQAKTAESLSLRACDGGVNQLPEVVPYAPSNCSPPTVAVNHAGVWIQNLGSVAVTLQGMSVVNVSKNTFTVKPTVTPTTSPGLPYTLNPGQTVVIDIGFGIGTKLSDQSVVTFITSTGNQFSASYPPPAFPNVGSQVTTTLSQTVIAPGGSVSDTATLSQVTSTAAGTITFNYFANGVCSGTPTPVGTPSTVNGPGVYTSSSQSFNSIGAYSWNAAYSGDIGLGGSDSPATSTCEPLSVSNVAPTITTTLSQAFVSVGASVYDTATLTGLGAVSGYNVAYTYFQNSICSASPASAGTFPVSPGPPPSAANSNPVTYNTAGSYSWYASLYSGPVSPANLVATSPCEQLTVNSGTTTITTTLSQSVIAVGGSVYDTSVLAQFSGGSGYQVQYTSFTNGICSAGATPEGSPVSVSSSPPYSVPNSISVPYSTPGSYSWYAQLYNGAVLPANLVATSPCESLTVGSPNVSLSTSLSPPQVSTFPVTISDSATESGVSNPTGYTVKYFYYTDGTCTTPAGGNPTGVVTMTSSPSAPASNPVTFNVKGSYSFSAQLYDPSMNFVTSSSCEPVSVVPAQISLTTSLSPPVLAQFPQTVFDTATVSGLSNAAGYSVVYSYFGGNGTSDGACATTPHNGGTKTIIAGFVAPSSNGVQYTVEGTYSWYAVLYDPNNNVVATSPCEQLVTLTSVPSAFGLGFISLDFNSYKALSTTGNCLPTTAGCTVESLAGGFVAGAPLAYTVQDPLVSSRYLVFSVNVTNTDPSGRNIVLDSESVLEFIQVPAAGTGGGTGGSTPWYLGSVSNPGGAISTAFPANGIEIPNQATAPKGITLYFAVTPGSNFNKYPPVGVEGVFMYLHGIMGKACTTLTCSGATTVGANEPLVVTLFDGSTITLSPTSGALGTSVAVTGSGFAATSTLSFSYDGKSLTTSPATVTSTGGGAIPAGVTFTVPTSQGGGNVVTVTDAVGDVATAVFTVSPAPSLSISPQVGSGNTNTVVTLTGSNYASSHLYGYCLSLSFAAVSCAGSSSTFTSTTGGAIPAATTLTVDQPGGSYYVVVYSTTNNVIATYSPFTIPVVTLSTTTGPLGTTVTVSGSGFTASSLLTFKYDGSALTTSPASVTSTATGAIPSGVTFTVPTSSGGTHTVSVSDATSLTSTATFDVTPAPYVVVAPVSGTHGVGTLVTLSGSNYADNHLYSYCLSTSATNSAGCQTGTTSTFTSDSSGNIPASVTLTANQASAGTYYIIVYSTTTGVVAASATFTET